MIDRQFSMLANKIDLIENGKIQCPAKVGKIGKISYIMEKFRELSFDEMQQINGGIRWIGTVWRWIRKGVETISIGQAIDEFGQGFRDGYNSVEPWKLQEN